MGQRAFVFIRSASLTPVQVPVSAELQASAHVLHVWQEHVQLLVCALSIFSTEGKKESETNNSIQPKYKDINPLTSLDLLQAVSCQCLSPFPCQQHCERDILEMTGSPASLDGGTRGVMEGVPMRGKKGKKEKWPEFVGGVRAPHRGPERISHQLWPIV